jgi:sister chromatid cohesion protein PDS5
VKQFKSLESPDDAYFSNAMHLLKVLETTKCIVIISDLGNSSTNLIATYFKTFFDLCSPTLNKDIEHMMSSILSHIIDEGEGLPAPVMEIILAQFIRKQPPKEKKKDQTDLTSLGIGGYPAAYIMAKGLCQDCADHLSRDICTYFSDVLLPDSPDEEIDIEDLEKAHFLINELYLASPHILSNTIPLLEAELHTEHSEVRSMAVECVGRMAGARTVSANFTVLYTAYWNAWLARRNDKNPNVRVKWIEALPDILANNPDVVEDISGTSVKLIQLTAGKLNELLVSPDDKVRLAAVKVFSTLSYNLLLSSIGKQSLEALADRCKDRKNTIRIEAMQVLARMWSLAYYDMYSIPWMRLTEAHLDTWQRQKRSPGFPQL